MVVNGVHFLAIDKGKARLSELDVEYSQASTQLEEAIKMGDLRENAEYEIAKAQVQRVMRERESLAGIMMMPIVKANDNIRVIEEGCIVKVTVWDVLATPVAPGSAEFAKLKEGKPSFTGVLMYGATLAFQDLLTDKALSVDTPVGRYILGKQPGDYSIVVPGGFACVTVEKLKNSTAVEELCCEI